MIYTASYFEPAHHHGSLISISRTIPNGFRVDETLNFLKPSAELLQDWKQGKLTESDYTNRYRAEIADDWELVIRLPCYLRDRQRHIRAAQQELQRRLGRVASAAELAEHLGWSLEQVQRCQQSQYPTTSLDEPLSNSGSGTRIDLIESQAPTPEEDIAQHELRELLENALAKLSDRQRKVLSCRFGLIDGQCQTLVAIARQMGITKERVRQLESEAMKKLQADPALQALISGQLANV
jgi:RNA polymerase sigma factor (sigma-70 family)